MTAKLCFVVFLPVIVTLAELRLNLENEVKIINSLQSSWTANLSFVKEHNFDEFKQKLGLLFEPRKLFKFRIKFLKSFRKFAIRHEKTFKDFDARKAWPNCTTIKSIKDQSNCGSCWAVSTASAISDRFCIATNGQINRNLSAEDLMRCCHECKNDDGCKGGDPVAALIYVHENGIVTGGSYGSEEGCMPYSIKPCSKSNESDCYNANNAKSAKCTSNCTNSKYPVSYKNDKFQTQEPYMMINDIDAIKDEIMSNGPSLAVFKVFSDFIFYEKGIYYHERGEELGWHEVRLLGFGTQNGINYWLCANSWGSDWGEDGFFKIRSENNSCHFGEYIFGAEPKVNKK